MYVSGTFDGGILVSGDTDYGEDSAKAHENESWKFNHVAQHPQRTYIMKES